MRVLNYSEIDQIHGGLQKDALEVTSIVTLLCGAAGGMMSFFMPGNHFLKVFTGAGMGWTFGMFLGPALYYSGAIYKEDKSLALEEEKT